MTSALLRSRNKIQMGTVRCFRLSSAALTKSTKNHKVSRELAVQKLHQFSTATKTSSATTTTTPKPYSAIPGDWRGRLPIIGAMPMFLPYAEKDGALRTEDFMRDQYEKYGKETGICRFGSNDAKTVLVFDVEAYLHILKNEGKYPSGILEGAWPITHYNDKYVNGIKNPFVSNGEDWRRGRMSINPYLFNIQAARTYLGAITNVARQASTNFSEYAVNGKLDRFCELAAFDMFLAASLGLELNSTGGDPQGLEFANKVIGALATMSALSTQCPYSKYDLFKFKQWDLFVDEWKVGREASKELVQMALSQGKGNGKGIMHGFLKDPNLKVSEEEATEMNLILTFAAADTTSSLINNVLTNLARHGDVQDKVRRELEEVLAGGDYHAEAKLPYMEQVLKENQRLTPPLPWVNVKANIPEDIVVAGYDVPAGSTVVFSHMGIKHDEGYAGADPLTFNPNRYSEAAVQARKGTKAEYLDHPICTKPFGFGARMCVGSRVAKLEYMSLICRLIQDYQLEYDHENSAPTIRLTKTTTTEQPCPKFRVARKELVKIALFSTMATTTKSNGGTTLLLIDVQKDFHPGGSLAIPTANDDAERIANLIRSQASKIDRIVATLDSHHKLHIAHPSFWMDGTDATKKPSPFTIISASDIETGKWKPRPTVRLSWDDLFDATVFENEMSVMSEDGSTFDLGKYCLEYAKQLEAKGRFQICVWPEHCLIGSEGHSVVSTVRQAMDEWSEQTGGSVEWVFKGENLLTEMYSALAADVPINKATAFNATLHQSLMKANRLIVCGQAMSHCVNYTARDIVEHCTDKGEASKIYLLTDCASAVPGFESAAETFQDDMKAAGVQLVTSSDIVGILVVSRYCGIGSTVVFSHIGIKHNEAYAGQHPLTFNADWYSEAVVQARKGTKAEYLDHPICTKPFGFGARMCLGSRVAKLEYMLLICQLIQDYQMEYDQENGAPPICLTKTTTTEQPCPKFRVVNFYYY